LPDTERRIGSSRSTIGYHSNSWASCQPFNIQDDEESYDRHSDDGDAQSDAIQEAIRNDELRRLERADRTSAESIILLAAKIISARIGASYEDGYDWCIEQVRAITWPEMRL